MEKQFSMDPGCEEISNSHLLCKETMNLLWIYIWINPFQLHDVIYRFFNSIRVNIYWCLQPLKWSFKHMLILTEVVNLILKASLLRAEKTQLNTCTYLSKLFNSTNLFQSTCPVGTQVPSPLESVYCISVAAVSEDDQRPQCRSRSSFRPST